MIIGIAVVFAGVLTALLMLAFDGQRPSLQELSEKYQGTDYFLTYNDNAGLLMTLSSADKSKDFSKTLESALETVEKINAELGMPASVVDDIRETMKGKENYQSKNKVYDDVVFHYNYMYEPYEKVDGNFEALTVVYKDNK